MEEPEYWKIVQQVVEDMPDDATADDLLIAILAEIVKYKSAH